MDELLDLVNESDQVIAQKRRSEIYQQKLRNFRVVNGFVINSQGQFWIPRRTFDKKIFPGGLDFSVGGHVKSGESYETAFRREAVEELGINPNLTQFEEIAYLSPYEHPISSFMKIYKISMNSSPPYNPHDFVEAFWLTPTALLAKLKQERQLPKSDLEKVIHILNLSL